MHTARVHTRRLFFWDVSIRNSLRSNNGTRYAPRYEEAFLPKAKNGLITSREVNEARLPRTCSRPCAFEEKKTKKKKHEIPLNTKKTHHEIYPQQPGDRDDLETACDETRPTRSPTFARFYISRGCGNRPRTALALSKNDECYTRTDRLTK